MHAVLLAVEQSYLCSVKLLKLILLYCCCMLCCACIHVILNACLLTCCTVVEMHFIDVALSVLTLSHCKGGDSLPFLHL
jgi:hypothetical protein